MNIEIADRLVKLRKEHNLSQEALASKLGLSRQAVSKWERAEASPDTDNLVALAELYGVPLDEILNGPKAQEEDTPNNEPTKAELKEKKLADMSERQRVGRKMVKFPFPILIAAAYLLLGFMNGNWHPGWIILLLIPVLHDCISIVGLDSFAPGKPLQVIVKHENGTEDMFLASHTYNEMQIGWFKAGCALNTFRKQ